MNRSMRSMRWRDVLTLILIAGAAANARAAAQLDGGELINMDLKSAPLVLILESFAQISDSRLDVEDSITGTVTLTLERTPWRQGLDRVCRDHRLRCEILAGEPSVLRVRSTDSAAGAAAQIGFIGGIDLALEDADLHSTLQAFGMIGQREVIVDDDVTGTLTIHIRNAPWTVVLEEACNLSGCEVEWGTSALRIRRAAPDALSERRAAQSFEGTPVAEALAILAGLPIFGALGQPELDLAGSLAGTVDVELSGANWQQAMKAICDAAGCEWQLTYGAPSRLSVSPKVAGLDQTIDLRATETTLGAAAAELARALDLEVVLEPGLDPASVVRFAATETIWRDAADELCLQAGCCWKVEERRLSLWPKVKALSGHPAARAGDRRLAVRFSTPGASTPVAGVARFTWASPTRTFDSGDRRWQLRLTWIPFGPDLHVVLPAIVHCAEEIAVEWMPPARLPLEEPLRQQWRGADLELSSPAGGEDFAPSGTAPDGGCLEPRGDRIQATFRPGAAGETTLDIEARVGTYLLLTPPTGPPPAAAILSLGTDAEGRQRVALLRPSPGGKTVAVERRTLPAGGAITEKILTPEGEIELALRHLPPP